MEHVVVLIRNPEEHAHKVRHDDPAEEGRLRERFKSQHKVRHLGTHGMRYSLMCCDDPETATGFTLGNIHTKTPDEIMRIIQYNMEQHGIAHAKATAHVELVANLDISPVSCGCKE